MNSKFERRFILSPKDSANVLYNPEFGALKYSKDESFYTKVSTDAFIKFTKSFVFETDVNVYFREIFDGKSYTTESIVEDDYKNNMMYKIGDMISGDIYHLPSPNNTVFKWIKPQEIREICIYVVSFGSRYGYHTYKFPLSGIEITDYPELKFENIAIDVPRAFYLISEIISKF